MISRARICEPVTVDGQQKTQISERILGGAVTALLCWWFFER